MAQSDEVLRTAEDIEPVYLKAIDQVDETQQRFDILKSGFEIITNSNLDRLQKIGVVFDERLQSLKDGASEASDILSVSSDHLYERVSDIENASKSAHGKIRGITVLLKDQSSDIHLITDQALLKVESIQRAVNEQFHELSASVGQGFIQLTGGMQSSGFSGLRFTGSSRVES